MSHSQKKRPRSTRPDPFARFEKKDILAIVKEVEDGLSRKAVSQKYGVAYDTLCKWVQLHSAQYVLGRPSYSMAFKRSIVQPIIEGKMSVRQASVSHNLKNNTVSVWVREFRKQDSDLAASNDNANPANVDTASDDQFALAKLKIQALETMIDIAEEQFKINIRKKPGAKQ